MIIDGLYGTAQGILSTWKNLGICKTHFTAWDNHCGQLELFEQA